MLFRFPFVLQFASPLSLRPEQNPSSPTYALLPITNPPLLIFSCHSIKFDITKMQTRHISIGATHLCTFYCSLEFLKPSDNPSAAFLPMAECTATNHRANSVRNWSLKPHTYILIFHLVIQYMMPLRFNLLTFFIG